MAPKALGVTSAKDLDGATVCIQTGTTTELNLADFFRSNNISYEPVPIETNAEAQAQYLAGACDVFTTDASGLASTRATFENPDDHIVLPEIVSKEPLGPLVRHGDNNWGDIARWTLNALITAEELGVTSANVAEHTANSGNNPEVNRLLGTEGDLGGMLGLDKQWASGEIDLLARNTTWTFSRDVDLKFEFVGVNYYDGQGFMAPKALGVTSAKDLDGATVCIQTGTTTELNLADFFRSNNISYEPVPIETNAEAQAQYLAGACDVFTTDASGLASTRATFENPDDHIVLPEIVSKEPLGPLVRHGDNNWGDIARWTLNALITAEELGVTSANVAEHTANAGNNPEVNRLLGTEGDLGGMLGLDKQWASRAIAVNGNYGEIFEKNIGVNTPIGIARGLNASWTNGGLIYSAPFR
ncbi:MAG: transporter substrate-binding domain-containing protein [Amylibacter sp.]|nr:transporter substrate-binding domain-containing protein [Amylibacter sp.]